MWVSDTSVAMKSIHVVEGSMLLAVTAGVRSWSLTKSLSFDKNTASSAAGTNKASMGGGSLTVSGAGVGTSR